MGRLYLSLQQIMRQYGLALLGACIIGTIYCAPYLFFMANDSYRGIPMMLIGDEETYIARMQDIIDGHFLLGSPVFYDYKNQLPIMPPTAEWLYALPSFIFHLPIINVVLASKFILPFCLFIAVYLFVERLIADHSLLGKFYASGVASMILLGYDLIDYRLVFNLLSGAAQHYSFLIWSRPVNPIIGAILLFSFLGILHGILEKEPWSWIRGIIASVLLALMFSSYFFSWGIALSIIGVFGALSLVTRNYQGIISLLKVAVLGVVISLPYWLLVFFANKSPWYSDAAQRTGLFYTSEPIINKFLVVVFVLLLLVFFLKKAQKEKMDQSWMLWSLAVIGGPFLAFNQQIITGIALWPFHFVQYSIPLGISVVFVSLYYLSDALRQKKNILILFVSVILWAVSITYGVSAQSNAYAEWYPITLREQSYASILNWLDTHSPRDSVVLVNDDESQKLSTLIPALTHNNVYTSRYRSTLVPNPKERFYHNYNVLLRLKGVTDDQLREYLRDHDREMRAYISNNLQDFFNEKKFSDVPLTDSQTLIDSVASGYGKFYRTDFLDELKKYRIDYIASIGPLSTEVIAQLPTIRLIGQFNTAWLYAIQ